MKRAAQRMDEDTRQLAVALWARGVGPGQVAVELGLSQRTVFYRRRAALALLSGELRRSGLREWSGDSSTLRALRHGIVALEAQRPAVQRGGM